MSGKILVKLQSVFVLYRSTQTELQLQNTYVLSLEGRVMHKKAIPDSLLTELREQGYSDEMIKEIYKWYDSSDYKGVTNF